MSLCYIRHLPLTAIVISVRRWLAERQSIVIIILIWFTGGDALSSTWCSRTLRAKPNFRYSGRESVTRPILLWFASETCTSSASLRDEVCIMRRHCTNIISVTLNSWKLKMSKILMLWKQVNGNCWWQPVCRNIRILSPTTSGRYCSNPAYILPGRKLKLLCLDVP